VSISPTFYKLFFHKKVFCRAFFYLQFGKEIGSKAAHKMLVNLTTGVNFTNILRAAFTLVGPKSAKRHCQLGCLFAHTGSAIVKAARRTLMKLSQGWTTPLFVKRF